MSIAATTRSFTNFRDGANLFETRLTSTFVQTNGISHLFDCMLPGDLRGSEGMPLIVPGLTMGDGELHDVLFIASMSNDVRAFDANTPNPETGQGQILWQRRVGNPIKGTRAMDMYLINDYWGILSTPVINTATNTLYVVSMSSPDGLIADNKFSLHSLSLIDGSDQAPPLDLTNASYTVTLATGVSKTSTLGNVARKQRCGLLFSSINGVDTVFIGAGSFLEDADTNQGWLVAVDVTTLSSPAIAASWTTTSRFSGGGLWMGGQGPSMDDDGFIYAMVGNGSFDGVTDFGESFIKLQYTPRTATTPASINIVDWFTPYTDTGRVGADPTIPDLSLASNMAFVRKKDTLRQRAPMGDAAPPANAASSNMNSASDEDLNSGGPLLLPMSVTGFTKDVIIGAGKDGIAYVLDMNNMGKTALTDFAPANIANNYAKLLSPPYGFTYYPDNTNLMPTDLSTIPTTYGGFTHHQHSTPVAYQSPDHGFMIFTGGENGPVRAFTLNPNFTLTYLACGQIVASANCANNPPGGMPGTMMTLSANGPGTNTAVLWCLIPYGDANKTTTPGRLVAYGANWIDQNGHLIVLWDSETYGNYGIMHNKFNIPAVINGKVYVPSYDGRVLVFG